MPGRLNSVASKRTSKNKGFTLVEVFVATVLTAIGAVSLMGAISSFTKAELAVSERELLSQLAHQKLEEMIATEEYLDVSSGSFEATGLEGYTWNVQEDLTGLAGLNHLRVIVTSPDDMSMVAETLIFLTDDVIDNEVDQ